MTGIVGASLQYVQGSYNGEPRHKVKNSGMPTTPQSQMPWLWCTRAYVAANSLVTAYITTAEKDGILHSAYQFAGPGSWLLVWIVVAIALVCLADVAINDLAPDKYHLRVVLKYRHLLHVFLAMGNVVTSYVVAVNVGWTPILATYWLDAAVSAAVALAGLRAQAIAYSRIRGTT